MENVGHSLAEEGRDNCRRGLVGTETVCVGRGGYACLEHGVMLLDGSEHIDKEGDELQVAHSVLARSEEQSAGVGSE